MGVGRADVRMVGVRRMNVRRRDVGMGVWSACGGAVTDCLLSYPGWVLLCRRFHET